MSVFFAGVAQIDQLDFKSLHFPRKREALSLVSEEDFRMQDLNAPVCILCLFYFQLHFAGDLNTSRYL